MARDAAGRRTDRLCSILCVTCCLSWTVAVRGEDKPADYSTRAEEQLKQLAVKVEARGSSAKKVQASATEEIPLAKLTRKQRQIAEGVLKRQSLYRRLPTISFETNADVYKFFTTHPDVAVSIWRAMEISEFQMWQTGKTTYEADAGDGSNGVIEVLYRDAERQLVFCEGLYKTPLLPKPIKARTLVYLRTSFKRDKQGRTRATHRGDLFVSLPSQPVETAAKIISPVSNVIADRNFREISLFVQMMSLAMTNRPGWVEHLATRLEGVLAIRKAQLVELAEHVNKAERKRQRSAGEDVSARGAQPSIRQAAGQVE